ncbi:KGK domain-containing protein [Aliterella atlantica]|uniref:KGK family protein n=1 Tax=Aliterella atlantica CENA595 TaxID=1618023 RepID=A0A0D8ZRK5_9CYAN|nr:KGK domain-containing protein [Aliterella atlantica]KJH71438.1 KGK family protein [Aliterella atlantica CENA595]
MNDNFKNLEHEDVITVYSGQIFVSSRTFTVDEFIAAMMQATKKQIGELTDGKEDWFGEGLDCKILKPGAKSWQRGKVRLTLEFTPENLDVVDANEANGLPQSKIDSPLDDIRQKMHSGNQPNNS